MQKNTRQYRLSAWRRTEALELYNRTSKLLYRTTWKVAKRQARRSKSRHSASAPNHTHMQHDCESKCTTPRTVHASPELEIKRLTSLQLCVQLPSDLAAASVPREAFVSKAPARAKNVISEGSLVISLDPFRRSSSISSYCGAS